MAAAAVIVDALGPIARRFYERYIFVPLTDEPTLPRLFLPMATIAALALPDADQPVTV